jgi:hypothetical protein
MFCCNVLYLRCSAGIELVYFACIWTSGGDGIIGPTTSLRYTNHGIRNLTRSVLPYNNESDYSGAAMFYGIEKFTFSESVYFCDVTVTTVGFGDNGSLPWNISDYSCSSYDAWKGTCDALCDYRDYISWFGGFLHSKHRR